MSLHIFDKLNIILLYIFVYHILLPLRFGWLLVLSLCKEEYLQILNLCPSYYAVVAVRQKKNVSLLSHTEKIRVGIFIFTFCNSENSIRLDPRTHLHHLPFWHVCWCRGFCHRTESDLFLSLNIATYVMTCPYNIISCLHSIISCPHKIIACIHNDIKCPHTT